MHTQSNRFKLPPFEASGGNIDATAPAEMDTNFICSVLDGTFVMPRSYDIEVLLIGGGGAGSAFGPPNGAGGGGAGGVVHHTQLTASGTLTINVGDGAAEQALSTKGDGNLELIQLFLQQDPGQ